MFNSYLNTLDNQRIRLSTNRAVKHFHFKACQAQSMGFKFSPVMVYGTHKFSSSLTKSVTTELRSVFVCQALDLGLRAKMACFGRSTSCLQAVWSISRASWMKDYKMNCKRSYSHCNIGHFLGCQSA